MQEIQIGAIGVLKTDDTGALYQVIDSEILSCGEHVLSVQSLFGKIKARVLTENFWQLLDQYPVN